MELARHFLCQPIGRLIGCWVQWNALVHRIAILADIANVRISRYEVLKFNDQVETVLREFLQHVRKTFSILAV